MRRTTTLVEVEPADGTGTLRVAGGRARSAPIGRRRYGQVRSTAVVVLKLVIALAIGLLFFLPLIWLISSALKTNAQEFAVPPTVIPRPVDWQNFSQVFTIVPFGTFYLNTTIIAVATVVGSVVSNTLVAYGFTKIQWPGRNVLFGVALATLMIPYLVILVPQYVLFYHFGWINTFLPLIVPAFGANPFYIFMLRQFLRTIPEELSDAARVDGARELRIMVSVILPQIRAAVATVAVFSFFAAWNDFIGPLIYLDSESKYTLALGLNLFVSEYSHSWAPLMAGVVLTMLPVVILFILFQRAFLRGVRLSGLMKV
jgi:multiple sugar transport system permease protein